MGTKSRVHLLRDDKIYSRADSSVTPNVYPHFALQFWRTMQGLDTGDLRAPGIQGSLFQAAQEITATPAKGDTGEELVTHFVGMGRAKMVCAMKSTLREA